MDGRADGRDARRAVAELLQTIQAPLVKTPSERGRLRKFLERLGEPEYGYGWRSYDYAGHRIVGHRGGVGGYRSLILFDPQCKSGVVAMWNSNTSQPGGLEFEVMDMLYHLPFRDWLELDRGPQPRAAPRSGGGHCRGTAPARRRVAARYAAAAREARAQAETPRRLNFPKRTGDGTARRREGFFRQQSGR